MEGWIKLHRCLLHNPLVMKDADYLAVWCYLLLKATHSDYSVMFGGKKIILKPGQYITGRKKLSSELHINESKIRRILNDYENDQQLNRKVTNKATLITIVNWELYQDLDGKVTNKRPTTEPTSDQQVTTKQEGYKNNKKNILLSFDKEFDALYKPYPKKKGKAPAKKKFIAWVTTGSTYAGQRYKFTIDEIFEAVNYYVETKEEWREWKDFSTLMNQIPDFVEGAKERDK